MLRHLPNLGGRGPGPAAPLVPEPRDPTRTREGALTCDQGQVAPSPRAPSRESRALGQMIWVSFSCRLSFHPPPPSWNSEWCWAPARLRPFHTGSPALGR